VNEEAVVDLFERVKNHPGVTSVGISHFCLSSAASASNVVERVADILELGKPTGQPWLSGQTGIETGSPELAKKHMTGKCRPYKPEEWPDVVVNAFDILSKNSWVPCATIIIGLPGSTDRDSKLTVEMVEKLRDYKSIIVPMFVVSNDTTVPSYSVNQMTPADGDLFLTCWEHDVRWTETLITEYLYTVDRSTAEGIKSVMSHTASSVTSLIHQCRDEYNCNVPRMIRELREQMVKEATS